jgi:hypothetical protein
MAIRVVFADDNFLVRQGAAALLAESAEVDVVAWCPTPPSCSPRSGNCHPTSR